MSGFHYTPPSGDASPSIHEENGFGWYLRCIRNYVTFSGRARRKEYWMFVLFSVLIGMAISLAEVSMGLIYTVNYSYGLKIGILSSLYELFAFLPALAVTFRRLHDVGLSGAWVLLVLTSAIVPLLSMLAPLHLIFSPLFSIVAPLLGVVSLIAFIYLIVLLAMDSVPIANQYGRCPK